MEQENCSPEGLEGPPPVYVRSLESDEHLSMVLSHEEAGGLPRTFNFKRPKSEPCEKLLLRIANNLKNQKKGKKKKKRTAEEMDQGDGPQSVEVGIFEACGQQVDRSVSSSAALCAGNVLRVGAASYRVVLNPPGVTRLRVPERPLTDCPVVAEVGFEFCEPEDCMVKWFQHEPAPDQPPIDAKGWSLVHSGPSFQFAEPGAWVKVSVQPRDRAGVPCGLLRSEVARGPVVEGPTRRSPIANRHEATKQLCDAPGFRVVSYNLLADFYADSEHSRNVLFPYCPEDCLKHGYRKQVLLWELSGYNADVLCLQEVDKTFFEDVLQPFFAPQFGARFLNKGTTTKEGVAVLFRHARFSLQEELSLPSITDALQHQDLGVELDKSQKFSTRWAERNQCLLALRLACNEDPERGLLVATTHLYFHPVADNVRLLQAAICFKHLEAQAQKRPNFPVVFAGDFNSDPRNGVFELATVGRTRATQADWFSQGREEYFGSPVIEHSLKLESAYDPRDVAFTNYTAGFRGVLDYIFFQAGRLRLRQAISLPKKEEVQRGVALPNELFPSDHLALIAELSF